MPEFASVVLVDPRGWLLLQERDEHPLIDPERWSLVGGHLDPGEDPLTAAYRELEEETGLRLPAGSLVLWRTVHVVHAAYSSTDPVHVHLGSTTVSDADVVCGEGRQIVFVEPARVPQLPLSALASLTLPALLDSPAHAVLSGGASHGGSAVPWPAAP